MKEQDKVNLLILDLRYDSVFNDEYYFKVKDRLQEVLNNQFNDIGFRFVNAVVYNPQTQELKAECFYMFNVMYYEFENEELKTACKQLYEAIIGR